MMETLALVLLVAFFAIILVPWKVLLLSVRDYRRLPQIEGEARPMPYDLLEQQVVLTVEGEIRDVHIEKSGWDYFGIATNAEGESFEITSRSKNLEEVRATLKKFAFRNNIRFDPKPRDLLE